MRRPTDKRQCTHSCIAHQNEGLQMRRPDCSAGQDVPNSIRMHIWRQFQITYAISTSRYGFRLSHSNLPVGQATQSDRHGGQGADDLPERGMTVARAAVALKICRWDQSEQIPLTRFIPNLPWLSPQNVEAGRVTQHGRCNEGQSLTPARDRFHRSGKTSLRRAPGYAVRRGNDGTRAGQEQRPPRP